MGQPNQGRISEDLRYELADAARAAESGNKPRGPLLLATLLFLIAGVALIVTLRQRESAARQAEMHSDLVARIDNLETQYQLVARLSESGSSRASEPILDILSRIEVAARTAGVRDKPAIPRPQSQVIQGAVRNLYEYKMQDPSLENLLKWVEAARADVPGLEVFSLEVAPAADLWKFNVVFVRWERQP